METHDRAGSRSGRRPGRGKGTWSTLAWALVLLAAQTAHAQSPLNRVDNEDQIDTVEELEDASEEPDALGADDVARELANPNTPLARLTLKQSVTFFEGDVPGSDDQAGALTLFQPVFPFPLTADGTTNLFVRPAFTFFGDQPTFDTDRGSFRSRSGLGDTGFDIALGKSTDSGLILLAGVQGTLPTATPDRLTGGQLRLGPELVGAYVGPRMVLGVFPSHQWDVDDWRGDPDGFSTTSIELFGFFLPGAGVTLGTNPTFSHDWKGDQWTVPVNLTARHTVRVGALPVQYGLSFDYFVEKNDDFGPKWALTFSLTPVVPNFIHGWLTD